MSTEPAASRSLDPVENFATPRVAAGALFFDELERVVLVHPTYKDTWDIPGGYVERGESPAAACQRELAEELGLHRAPLRLLSVDWAPSEKEGDKLLFLFDCGPLGEDAARVVLDGDEVDDWRWVALADLDAYVIPRISRRVRSVASSGATYLEHGDTVGPTFTGSGRPAQPSRACGGAGVTTCNAHADFSE